MAKKSWIAKDKKRMKMIEKYAEKRRQLKEAGDYMALAQLPRDSSVTRRSNRCVVTGRKHGYIRHFGVSRIVFRELAHEGKLPGVTKASW
ncbi:MAG: 30S ribosomal protein S14 [Deinococcota bacterium]